MHRIQKSKVFGTLAGKSMKYALCRTWSPTISRTMPSVRTAVSTTAPSESPDKWASSSVESLKPTDISAASNCCAATAPSPTGPVGQGMRWVCRMTRGSSRWTIPG